MRVQSMFLVPVLLFVVTAGAVSGECEYCMSGNVYCSVVWEYSEQYTEDAEEECFGQGSQHLTEVHAFDEDFGSCGDPEFMSGSIPATSSLQLAAIARGVPPDGCRACGWQSECHEESDLGDCHEGCGENFASMVEAVRVAAADAEVLDLAAMVSALPEISIDAGAGAIRLSSSCGDSKTAYVFLHAALVRALRADLAVGKLPAAVRNSAATSVE